MDKSVCHYCGVKVRRNRGTRPVSATDRTWDHIVPTARGGSYHIWNLVIACYKCNQEKGVSWTTCTCERCSEAMRKHAERSAT